MKTEFKDVAHLYLGCNAMVNDIPVIVRAIGYGDSLKNDFSKSRVYLKCKHNKSIIDLTDVYEWDAVSDTVNPILRALSDMTADEFSEIFPNRTVDAYNSFVLCGIDCIMGGSIARNMKTVLFLISKHFDLFGLIESGQAIDKTTLK